MDEGYIVKNPARSRPLSPNVKRLMRQSRMAPQNPNVVKLERRFSGRDRLYCHLQGNVFMEAAAMGLAMADFAPEYMNSQLAGVIDVSFSRAAGMEDDALSNMLKIPMLLKSPETIVETLYWIKESIRSTGQHENKSAALVHAIQTDALRLPAALAELPRPETLKVSQLAYAYWLGYIYRCESLLHEESSRMVYGAFPEKIMQRAYQEIEKSALCQADLSECAMQICAGLDRLLVEKLWKNDQTVHG